VQYTVVRTALLGGVSIGAASTAAVFPHPLGSMQSYYCSWNIKWDVRCVPRASRWLRMLSTAGVGAVGMDEEEEDQRKRRQDEQLRMDVVRCNSAGIRPNQSTSHSPQ